MTFIPALTGPDKSVQIPTIAVVNAAGLTERQALALALEESRRAAVAAKHFAMQVRSDWFNQHRHVGMQP